MVNVKHIKVLGFGDSKILGNVNHIKKIIETLINNIDMRPLGETIIFDVPLVIEKLGKCPFEDEGGITAQIIGFSTLSTSHCAIHTWPLRKEFHLDIYSCRLFSKEKIINYINNSLKITKIKISDLTEFCEWN